jgi:putative transposase
MEQYVGHLHDVLGCLAPDLRQRIGYIAADGYYSKQGFIEAVRQQDKHLVGKMRCDANLKYLFSGPRSTGPGRPKQYDGKVDYQDWSRWEPVQQEGISPEAPEEQSVHIYSIVAYAPNFKINLRVVAIVTQQPNKPPKHQLFFSTDLTQDPQQILQIYAARFQMEFLFRDTKQHLGLQDCQSRQPRSIEFHYNMALSTLNFAKLQQLNAHQGTPDTFTFSIEDAKRRAYNQLFASRILSILPQIPTCDKYLKPLQELLGRVDN